MQSKVLSINASVEAARQRGAFSVIADEVRRVSQRSALAVTQVEDAIKRVAAVVGSQFTEASVKAQAEDAADRARLQHFAELVARRAEGQRVAEAQRQKLLTDVARQHDDLSRRVVQLLAMTQFQDVCGQQVDGVRKALEQGEQVIRGIAQALAPGATGTVASTLDASALLQTYVMGSQREAHAAVTGAAFVDDTDRIELF
jgi:methyl-accepting chemotaxis protein